MYIWILLATIMIGLNFFNLSVRPDKEGSYTEVKASSIVTRFKLENMALVRFLQCETLLRLHTDNWDAGSPPYRFSVDSTDTTNYKTFTYYPPNQNLITPEHSELVFKPEDSLPAGYQGDAAVLDNGQVMHHYLYCMDRPLEHSGAHVMSPCQYGSVEHPVYMVSFAQIPSRWLTKDGRNAPLPVFLRYLSDEKKFSGVAGYTECSSGHCVLRGVAAQKAPLQESESGVVYTQISPDSPLWSINGDFNETCGAANTPCMFMYQKMPTTDEKSYCRRLLLQDFTPDAPIEEPIEEPVTE